MTNESLTYKMPETWGSFQPEYTAEFACEAFAKLLYYLFTLQHEGPPR